MKYVDLSLFLRNPDHFESPVRPNWKQQHMEMLKHKVAVVFAASGQIAGAVARSFAQHGAKVYVTGRNLKAVIDLADEIKAAGGQAEAGKVDALNENEIDSYLQKSLKAMEN
jgi:NADP-dependent 3-hydroxy acid dehydrogenase YdfG